MLQHLSSHGDARITSPHPHPHVTLAVYHSCTARHCTHAPARALRSCRPATAATATSVRRSSAQGLESQLRSCCSSRSRPPWRCPPGPAEGGQATQSDDATPSRMHACCRAARRGCGQRAWEARPALPVSAQQGCLGRHPFGAHALGSKAKHVGILLDDHGRGLASAVPCAHTASSTWMPQACMRLQGPHQAMPSHDALYCDRWIMHTHCM